MAAAVRPPAGAVQNPAYSPTRLLRRTMRKRWLARPAPRLSVQDPPPDPLMPPPLSLLLSRRGIDCTRDFLFPELSMLSPWRSLPGLEQIVDSLLRCAGRQGRILVWGDYDADGLTSSAIMITALRSLGADVRCRIPERLSEGYGLGRSVLDVCESISPEILLCVDCGTSAGPEIDSLDSSGIQVLVLDHHEPGDRLPASALIANPRVGSSGESWNVLSASGICYAAFRGLRERSGLLEQLERYSLALSAVGTICDVVPLTLDSRIIASLGLLELGAGAVPGLIALAPAAGVRSGSMTSEDIAFRIGPRLNACGRVGSATDALDLLLASETTDLGPLCRRIEDVNDTRRRLDRMVSEEALAMAAKLGKRRSILLASRNWHRGVLGIAASRLSAELGVPVALVSIDEEGFARGSARSVPGVPLHEIFRSLSDLLIAGGGHSQAAGLTFRASDLDALSERFESEVSAFAPEPAGPVIYLDGRLAEGDLDSGLALGLLRLEPFGEGNEEPVWITSGAVVTDVRKMGGGRHLGLSARIGSKSIRAVGFGMGGLDIAEDRSLFDLAYTVRLDYYRGGSEIVLHLRDMRPSR